MTSLVLLDHPPGDSRADLLAPITTARPLAEVRVGARLVRERWASAFGVPVAGVIAASRFIGFDEPGSAPVLHDDVMLEAGTIIALSAFAPSLQPLELTDTDTWVNDGTVVAATLTSRTTVADVRANGVTAGDIPTALDGWKLEAAWDLIGHLPSMLAADTLHIARATLPPDSMKVFNCGTVLATLRLPIQPRNSSGNSSALGMRPKTGSSPPAAAAPRASRAGIAPVTKIITSNLSARLPASSVCGKTTVNGNSYCSKIQRVQPDGIEPP